MAGDQILSINDDDTRNATQDYAAAILKVMIYRKYPIKGHGRLFGQITGSSPSKLGCDYI